MKKIDFNEKIETFAKKEHFQLSLQSMLVMCKIPRILPKNTSNLSFFSSKNLSSLTHDLSVTNLLNIACAVYIIEKHRTKEVGPIFGI